MKILEKREALRKARMQEVDEKKKEKAAKVEVREKQQAQFYMVSCCNFIIFLLAATVNL